jgi:hypothetical protein
VADGLSDVWRSALDANVRYYEAWGRAVEDYVRDLGAALKGYSPVVRLPAIEVPLSASTVRPSTVTSSTARSSNARSSPSAAAPAVVLEADVGRVATGAVLVQNHLAHPVSAAVTARVDADHEVQFDVEPAYVELAPGEAAVVRVSTTVPAIDQTTEIRGELLVPELVGTTVPLVVRRLPGSPPPDEQPAG